MFGWLQHLFTARALEQEIAALRQELAVLKAENQQLKAQVEQLRQVNGQHQRETDDLKRKLQECIDSNGPLEPEHT